MSVEFLFVSRGDDGKIAEINSEYHAEDLSCGMLLFKNRDNVSMCQTEQISAWLIGEIYNIDTLRLIVGQLDGQAWSLNPAEVLLKLKAHLGNSALSLAEGDFCLFMQQNRHELVIVTDPLGLNLVSVVKAERLWITNSLKMVGEMAGSSVFHFMPATGAIFRPFKADDFSPIGNVVRLKPGSVNTIARDCQYFPYLESQLLSQPAKTYGRQLKQAKLLDLIDQVLRDGISVLAEKSDVAGIPLSGGLDSSLVTMLACHYFRKVKTWSIGTEQENEFAFSSLVAEALGTEHEVKILSDGEILSGLVNAIYHNEIYDGLSAEIQCGLFTLYPLVAGKVSSLLTGYGADLLFGGILNTAEKSPDPNALLAQQVYRTRWTGEFVTHGARHYGLRVYHPFWRNGMIALCRHLEPAFKIKDNEVKYILRVYADMLKELPKEIVWRKKIGIHEGSALNHAFARIIGTGCNNYQRKTQFSYWLWQQFLTAQLAPEQVTLENLPALLKGSPQ